MGEVNVLFRGNHGDEAGRPDPAADRSLVRHILYRDGYGRSTPYLSLSESQSEAATFGPLWMTSAARLADSRTGHLTRDQLLHSLQASSTGRARWPNTRERLRAIKYVEHHAEHLADYSSFADLAAARVAVTAAFTRAKAR